MVKKQSKIKVGVVISTPQGLLIPSAATLAKMKAAQKKSKKK
jgi:hypothetical protein